MGSRLETVGKSEGSDVGLLDEVFGLFARRDETSGDTVDLVCKRKRFLLEMDAVSCALCDSPGFL